MGSRGDCEFFYWVSGSVGCGKRRKETRETNCKYELEEIRERREFKILWVYASTLCAGSVCLGVLLR